MESRAYPTSLLSPSCLGLTCKRCLDCTARRRLDMRAACVRVHMLLCVCVMMWVAYVHAIACTTCLKRLGVLLHHFFYTLYPVQISIFVCILYPMLFFIRTAAHFFFYLCMALLSLMFYVSFGMVSWGDGEGIRVGEAAMIITIASP